ncbi:MAG: type III-B CRISPR module RAMP protein Cmr4 [bacterium]|nr:type III-B CRISPR module RAMP protein Cmr4 [bacterium]
MMSKSTRSASLLFLHAQTSMHPGSGTALGVVDLPIQRERHTQWPLVPASSLKGVLRDACRRRRGDKDEGLLAVFGPETAEADKHAGALAVTDARLLAFPVRSLKGVFAWVTCPAVLERLARDLALAGLEGMPGQPVQADPPVLAGSCLVEGGKMILEDEAYDVAQDTKLEAMRANLAGFIARQATTDEATIQSITARMAILHNDDFTHFVRHATEITARIGLDYETKTVKNGALFYQEFLPPETLFYTVVLAEEARRKGQKMTPSEVLEFVQNNLPPVLQIGGDETTGKGYCFANFWPAATHPAGGH